ncbi:chondroitin sulfate N-acetylgalactosaminyltransferase 1-like [Saccoglossus kowalevskii]|uniref:Hexosyltransferase n=1 Tax=Saccoglossus kowalevskii TaxID=10224 RepID=A0ABM0GV79_SACKO|nr:PREDICTED: chondroitin sulfate N-acetylgalactosaminyltransferase 1-like [Saccoglossus kowalevskii]
MPMKEFYLGQLAEKDEQHRAEVETLKQQITDLKAEIIRQAGAYQQVEENGKQGVELQENKAIAKIDTNYHALNDYMQQQIKKANTHQPMKDEYELNIFNSFTAKLVYHIDGGLAHRPSEKPKADKKDDLVEAVYSALEMLNSEIEDHPVFSVDNFLEGLYRTDQTVGSLYDLLFKSDHDGRYHRIELLRPFAPIQKLRTSVIEPQKQTINMIIPLSGRLEKFYNFMERFEEICIKTDKNVFLTIVYFGQEGLDEIHTTLQGISIKNNYKQFKLINLEGDFSRGRGLEEGVKSWHGENVLLFFCDVDIAFSSDFLERCRIHSQPGKKVYYPIVFSLYNPAIVYEDQVVIPLEEDQLRIHKDTGFWRDFGYGMTCQFRSDFVNIKGFDMDIKGWGMEDVHLYRKYLHSNLSIIRVPDRGIFHLYHIKNCDPELTTEQYKACIGSKALNEASHTQLGMLAFKAELQAQLEQSKAKQVAQQK